MAFPSRSLKSSPVLNHVRRHPFLFFGLPFLSIVVGSSFALQSFTRTRYDYHAQKVQTVSWEEDLGIKDRKKVDIREEYYRLNNPAYAQQLALEASRPSDSDAELGLDTDPDRDTSAPRRTKKFSLAAVDRDELENVRVPRPAGVPEWGVGGGGGDAPLKGQRKEDRWV